MRKNNLHSPKRPLKLKPILLKWIFFVIVIITALYFAAGSIKQFLFTSDYFKIKDIITSEGKAIDLSYLKGQNILSVDLDREAAYISEFYPGYRRIMLYRLFPNRIYARFIKRVPLAYVKLYRYFYVDWDMVLFNIPTQGEIPDLPVIFGLETKIFGPKSGRRYVNKELATALSIIKEVNLNRTLRAYQIKRIEVARLENTSFFIAIPLAQPSYGTAKLPAEFQPLEIKIGPDNIKERVSILNTLLAQIKNEWNNIAYVDLRFNQPVIKLKSNKER